ncbi:MAG: proline racemase family protein [Phycisphaerales bacterium]|nr:proline racemase family protein [Phycisphaerales bacterium]
MRISIVDSHTEGEPTRVVLDGPDLGSESMEQRVASLRGAHDSIRRGILLEPRGSEVQVAAFLGEPVDDDADASVIFANNVGVLGMCVHGTIGVVRTLQHLGRATTDPGTRIHLDTPVGRVAATIEADGGISVENVPSRRTARSVRLDLHDRTVHADIAWGGNWFALVEDHGESIEPANRETLLSISKEIRRVMNADGLDGKGTDAGPIDHVELFGPGRNGCDSRNFVLCPGGAYDRSPCGTGTSAKIACLAADGGLEAGDSWVQESIIGSRFEASWRPATDADAVIPTITGRAWITGEGILRLDPDDPYRFGID